MATKKRIEAPAWDVEYEGRNGEVIKLRVKRYTFRDSLLKAKLESQLAAAMKESAGDDDLDGLFLIGQYPLMKYGLEAALGIELPLTEEAFWELPEILVLETTEKIREVNPQHAIPFLELMKMTSTDWIQKVAPITSAAVESESIVKRRSERGS